MPFRWIDPKVACWASVLDEPTAAQARATASLPIIAGHVALMADAHLGMGATIGSVIPTRGALIPAAVGVDIGCGMEAVETNLFAEDLPADLEPLLLRITAAVPAGVGEGHDSRARGRAWFDQAPQRPATALSDKQVATLSEQFGTLGSGNHYLEVTVDERSRVWIILHSGSRGIGNQFAQQHIRRAKDTARRRGLELPDRDLAWLEEGTEDFDAYVADLRFAQSYAAANRAQMIEATAAQLFEVCDGGEVTRHISCHHNYATTEQHGGEDLWITRKGAIRARDGDLGLIPGSMGTASYVVRGRGEPTSFHSCAHGAGRVMSRSQARKRFTEDDLLSAMGARTWRRVDARRLVDEIPGAYKDIEAVMADQADLVEPLHVLRQVLNYKGT